MEDLHGRHTATDLVCNERWRQAGTATILPVLTESTIGGWVC